MRFSERHGYRTVRDALQVESMDDRLRGRLFNALAACINSDVRTAAKANRIDESAECRALTNRIWDDLFGAPVSTAPASLDGFISWLNAYIVGAEDEWGADWYAVYDLIEAIVDNYRWGAGPVGTLTHAVNRALEAEGAGYRLVDGHIVPIINEAEVQSVETALREDASGLDGARTHIRRALELLADRESRDYRNSIKESVSAVESAVVAVSGADNVSRALSQLREGGLHPALVSAMDKLWGYASDERGVRHAMGDDSPAVGVDEAILVLVIASALLNYLSTAGRSG